MKQILLALAPVAVNLGFVAQAAANATADETTASDAGQEQNAATAKEGWTLVWSDEFDGVEIDPAKWSHDVDCWGGGNEERQCYTDRPENSAVSDGYLTVTAQREWMRGSALPAHMRKTPEDAEKMALQPFSSARLVTKGKADWLYGRFEARAKLPEGQGAWSAIWMLPSEDTYGGWAASGEIDIVEAVNLGASCKRCAGGIENRIIGTVHFGGEWPENVYKGEYQELPESEDGFHVFAVEWKEGEISWFVDDIKYSTLTSRSWRSSTRLGRKSRHAPFDHPFYLIINLAIGGHLAEQNNDGGIDLDAFPKSMMIDWVRVYQRDDAGQMPQ
jgi:beta-glucanase (GH16 family)